MTYETGVPDSNTWRAGSAGSGDVDLDKHQILLAHSRIRPLSFGILMVLNVVGLESQNAMTLDIRIGVVSHDDWVPYESSQTSVECSEYRKVLQFAMNLTINKEE